MNTVLKEFIEFVNTTNSDEVINHNTYETCAIGRFYEHIGDPITNPLTGKYTSPHEKAKNVLEEMESIPSFIKKREDIFYDVCECQTYGELKTLMAKVEETLK